MEEFDINEFARMFDAALASDNPSVKKALRNFMMIAAIVHAQELDATERNMGPLETLVKKVYELERIVSNLKNNQNTYVSGGTKDYWRDNYYGTYPTWVYNPNTSSTSGTAYSTTSVSIEDYNTELKTILKDLKIT